MGLFFKLPYPTTPFVHAKSPSGKVGYYCPVCHKEIEEISVGGNWLDVDTKKISRGQRSYICTDGHWGPWRSRIKTSLQTLSPHESDLVSGPSSTVITSNL